MNEIKVPIGGMWDHSDWTVRFNEPVQAGITPCPHCRESRPGHVICTRVVVATNEAGFNTTGVCLDCIIEAAAKLG